jgi:hypothetical protein
MHSKNKPKMTAAERNHVERVKAVDCVLCDAAGPSEVHEIEQGQWFTCIALCPECHRGTNGWHGTKALWRLRKWAELDALNETLRRLSA